jgi:alpha-1,6-mannosyltransferase
MAVAQVDVPNTPWLPAELRGPAALGAGAAVVIALGGALAGAAGPPAAGDPWLWAVPTVPVRPVVDLLPALVAFYGGLVVLSRAWLRLRRAVAELDAPPPSRHRAVLLVCALWAVPLVLGPPLGSRDVYAYAAVGEVVQAGFDPYEVGPAALGDGDVLDAVDPLWREQPTPYGPSFVFVARAAAGLAGAHVLTAVLVYRLVALAGLALVAAFLPRLATRFGGDPAVALVLVLANPLTLLHLVSGAHNEALLAGLLVAGLAIGSAPRSREVPPGLARASTAAYAAGLVLCTLAAGIKVPAALAVVWLAWNRPERDAPWSRRVQSVLVGGVLAGATLAATAQLTGAGWGWTETLGAAGEVTAYLSPTAVLSKLADLVGPALGLSGPGTQVGHLVPLVGMAAAGLLATGLLARSHRAPSGLRPLGAAFLAVALLLPAVHPWYLVWGLVLLAAADSKRRSGFLVLSVAMTFVVLPGGPDLGRQLLDERSVGVVVLTLLAMSPLVLPWSAVRQLWLRLTRDRSAPPGPPALTGG